MLAKIREYIECTMLDGVQRIFKGILSTILVVSIVVFFGSAILPVFMPYHLRRTRITIKHYSRVFYNVNYMLQNR